MLRLGDFIVGDLSQVQEPDLTIVLPRTQYEHTGIAGVVQQQRFVITLDGDLPCQAYPFSSDEPWNGLLIPGVDIEVDIGSVFDPAGENVSLGAIIREADQLDIVAASGQHQSSFRRLKVTLLSGLPAGQAHQAAGFRSWRITKGRDADKQVLFTLNPKKVAEVRATTLKNF